MRNEIDYIPLKERRDYKKKKKHVSKYWEATILLIFILAVLMWIRVLAPRASASEAPRWDEVHSTRGACLNIQKYHTKIVNIPLSEIKSTCAEEGITIE